MTTKTEMTLENVKAGDRVICRKELSHPKFIKWKEYDIVIQGESLYIVSHTYDLFSINESTLEIINEHFTLVTREDVITLSNAAFMYIKGEQDSESIRKIYDEKVTDEINKTWWLNHHYYSLIHGILSPSMHEPNKHILSTSDYLLLLSAPESQAHLLTEKENMKQGFENQMQQAASLINIANSYFNSELASQPPVMEGKEEDIYNLSVSALSTIRTIKDFCNNSGISKMAESAEKDLIKIFDNARDNVDSEKYANQKTAPLQDEIKSLRYDLFHVTANEQSLQSEVEQLKGLLRECMNYLEDERAIIEQAVNTDNYACIPDKDLKLIYNQVSKYLSK